MRPARTRSSTTASAVSKPITPGGAGGELDAPSRAARAARGRWRSRRSCRRRGPRGRRATVAPPTQRRRHLRVGVVAERGLVGERQVVRRDLGGDVDAALRARADQRRSRRRVETCATCRCAPVSSREHEVARDVHHSRRSPGCPAGRAASRRRPRSPRRRATSVRSSACAIIGAPRPAASTASTRRITPLSMIVLPSSLNATAPAATSARHLGHHLAREALRRGRDRAARAPASPCARGRGCSRSTDGSSFTGCGVGHARDRGEACRAAAARPPDAMSLLVLLARLAQVRVQIDEAGRDPAGRSASITSRVGDRAELPPTATTRPSSISRSRDGRRARSPGRARARRAARSASRHAASARRASRAAGEQVEDRHAQRDAVAHLIEDHAGPAVGEVVRELDAAVHRAWMHHDRVVLRVAELRAVDARRSPSTRARSGRSAPSSRSLLDAQRHHHVGAVERLAQRA